MIVLEGSSYLFGKEWWGVIELRKANSKIKLEVYINDNI